MTDRGVGYPRSKMSRRWPIACGPLAALMVFSSLGVSQAQTQEGVAAADGHKKVTIVAQSVPTPKSTDVASIAMREVLQAFHEKYPYIEIKPFVMPSIEGSSMDSAPLMAIAAGIPANALYVNFRQSSTFIEHGFLAPLEVLLARVLDKDHPKWRQTDAEGKWLEDPTPEAVAEALALLKSRVRGPVWPVVYREGPVDDEKHVWALPYNTLVQALLYRKDLFAAAGLNPDQPPKDWNELLEYARLLTVPERQQYGMYISSELSWGTYTFLVSNGGRAVEQDADGKWQAVYDSRDAAEAYVFAWKLMRQNFEKDGETIPGAVYKGTGSEVGRMWDAGQIGMRFNYLKEDMLADINPQQVGVAPVPVTPSGKRGSEINATMLGVFAASSAEKQLATMEFIWFLTSDQAQEIKTRVMVEHGFGPFVSPEMLEKFGYDRILKRVPEGWRQAFEVAMNNGVPEPYGSNTQNIYSYMSRPLEEIMRGDADLQDKTDAQRIEIVQDLLAESAHEFNVKVLGNLTPGQIRFRRIVGAVVIGLVALVFGFGFWSTWKYFSNVSRQNLGANHKFRLSWGYLLLAPGVLLVIGWAYMPLVGGALMSLMDYQLVLKSTFVGLDNFAAALFDDRFWAAFARTLYYVALIIGLGFWPPILLAILLDEVPTSVLKYVYRTIYYLPAVISGIIVMFLWKQLFSASPFGPLNQALLSLNHLGPVMATVVKLLLAGLWLSAIYVTVRLPFKLDELSWLMRSVIWALAVVMIGGTLYIVLGPLFNGENPLTLLFGRYHLEALDYLGNPDTAMLCCVLPSVWAGAGPGCLLYLAALKTVPEDLYEAADIDGASNWHKIFYITLPQLKFLIVIQFIAAVVAAFKGGANFILAMAGTKESTMILALDIFIRAFLELQFGFAAAMAWILGALLVGFTAWQMRMLARAEFKAGGK